jgi:thiol-disulfide isomerase/thioredoxin
MQKFGKRFYIEAAALFVIGVLIISSSVYLRNKEAEKMTIYYIFSPDCPNCNAAKPIIDSLRPEIEKKKIQFVELNVKEFDQWRAIYKYLTLRLLQKVDSPSLPIPTAVVRRNGRFYTFVGKDSVSDLNDFLHLWVGTKKIPATLKK